ncbi:MAG: glycerate kinase [Barnesiella sp.]
MKKIVVASDSFKGCLSSLQVADAVRTAIIGIYPACEVVSVPMADGGEGTMATLVNATRGHFFPCNTYDPLMRPINAFWGVLGDGLTAVIELAQASGLMLLNEREYNPEKTTTYGTGIIIAEALRKGFQKIILAIGGSATNDAAIGLLSALGFHFLDEAGNEVKPAGGNLKQIVSIDDKDVMPELRNIQLRIACDVDNPLYGTNGAAHMFAPQKGADEFMTARLDCGLRSFAKVVEGKYNDRSYMIPGVGAAGGVGYGLKVFLNAELVRGADWIMDVLRFEDLLKGADLVITGEGSIDSQTIHGKVPVSVARRARLQNIPVWAVGGKTEDIPGLANEGISRVITVTPPGMRKERALNPKTARENIIHVLRSALLSWEKEVLL